jgi:hypothetical protein
MGQAFEVTARLNLLPPKNLKAVANQIHKTLSGVSGSVGSSPSFSPAATKNLTALRQQMAAVATQTVKTTKAVDTAAVSMADFGAKTAVAAKRFAAFSVAAGVLLTVFGKAVKRMKRVRRL